MNKNLNPLNWTKKQQIIGGAVAIVLIGGVTTGIVNHANHQAKERKIEALKNKKIKLCKARAEKAKQLEKSPFDLIYKFCSRISYYSILALTPSVVSWL